MNNTFKIGFFGGSITQGGCAGAHENSFAYLAYKGIEKLLGSPCEYLNAAISGTGSEFGVYRIKEHLLFLKPDVIFIEFAVNDAWTVKDHPERIFASMDRLITRIRENCPGAAVIFVYTALQDIPTAASVHEQVAKHYGIPTIDMAAALYKTMEQTGKKWENFVTDTAHPNDAGHALYAKTILEALQAHPEWLTTPPNNAPPLVSDPMPDARIAPIEEAELLCGFAKEDITGDTDKHLPHLEIKRVLRADKPGAKLRVTFTGTTFGLYHRISPRAGGVRLIIDGEPKGENGFYWNYPNVEDRGEFLSFCRRDDLPAGTHTAEVETVSGKLGDTVEIAGFLIG